VGGLTMPVDTANQVVCTVYQIDVHSNPDHTTSQADIQWNRIGPQATPLIRLNGLTGSVLVPSILTGLTKGCLEKQTYLSIAVLTVSGQCTSVAIIKWISIFVHTWRVFAIQLHL